MPERLRRVNELLREELSDLIQREIKDPRLNKLLTVTEVETSPDLRHARVFVSLLGSPEERNEVMRALQSAASFLRRELRGRVRLHHIPELSFRYDDRIEEGARILSLLNEVKASHTGTLEEGPESES